VPAAIASCLLVSVAVGALYVTSLPKYLALALEPASLLLMPGLVIAIAVAGQHDFAASVVVEVSAGFYLVVFWLWFRCRARASRQRGGRSGQTP
jgi:hypothetical protein